MFSNNKLALNVIERRLDLKNQTEPYEWYFELLFARENKPKTIKLDQNEAVLQDTMVGFLEKEAEPVNFLTMG